MKILFGFIRKEIYHVLRDKWVLLILIFMPIIQILLFGFALSNEVKNNPIAVFDASKDSYSRQLTDKINASRYFDLYANVSSQSEIEELFKSGKIKVALCIPPRYGEAFEGSAPLQPQIILDATDLNISNQINQFLQNIIQSFIKQKKPEVRPTYSIIPEVRMMYNPQLKGAPNFVPGVMAMIMLLVCVLMTSVAIVKEKETGTMEVLLVSPMRPSIIIISKAIPYFILSVINYFIILAMNKYLLDVPVKGSLLLLTAVSFIFILTSLFLGILISHTSQTQQEAMFKSLIGMMLPTVLLSGFMFPIENMPLPLQFLSNIIPSRWYYSIIKNVMIQGSGLEIIWRQFAILGVMCLVLFIASIKKFKVRLE